jgi:hypothetical protein
LTGGNVVRLGRFLTLLGQCRTATGAFDAAQSSLNEAHAILSEAEGATPKHHEDVLTGLVELYDAWHGAEPDKGYDQKAAERRAKLAEWQASTQPASQPATASASSQPVAAPVTLPPASQPTAGREQ